MRPVSMTGVVIVGLVGFAAGWGFSVAHDAAEGMSGLSFAQQVLTIVLLIAATAAALAVLRGGDGYWQAVLAAAALTLCAASIQGAGGWAAPLALAAVVIAPLFVRPKSGDAPPSPPAA